eukprot:CAMPEP_0206010520 /NCGR_PEP_ID=MMETSP1464-20131121/11797_1 /ASSEMBLY_ACC=CAM_ASM_001124 /TAXON_ID=119497 /ORGANISM="Exanthemachrysis gayraliae, Strain RCC1523" /LENGTH=32 /DNA_ID= /DNA_START= /DNA_END= /DNA_ORIENTATION=
MASGRRVRAAAHYPPARPQLAALPLLPCYQVR